jgi:hypothetical protein
MKIVSKQIINRSLVFLVLIFTQVQAWAQETMDTGTTARLNEAFTQPRFWIGLVLFIGCIAAFFLVGREKKDPQYQ